jgi:phosphate-selective porin OprO/OprP
MYRVFQQSLRWAVPCAWLTLPFPLHAVDEETAKTISDLKTQVQALMDEVKKLKDQVSKGSPPPARLQTATPDQPSTTPRPADQSGQFDPVPHEAEQPTMELPEGGTSETAPKPEQEGDKRLPMLDVSDRGLIFRSKDNAHSIRLGGLLQLDDREFVDPSTSQESKFLIRRARPYASGYFYDDWEYRFAPEFALSSPNAVSYQTTIADAFINFETIEEIQVEAGKFKPPLALEMLASDAYLPFAERALTSSLSPNRDIGVMVHGRLFDGKLSYSAMVGAGARNDTLNTGLDYDTGPDGYFRLYAQPFLNEEDFPEALHGLRLGIGGSIGWASQSTASSNQLFQNYSTDGGNTFLAFPNGLNVQGEHWRISPQLYYNYGPFGLLGEFIAEKQGVNTAGVGPGGGFTSYESTAWNITMNYVLTGEKTSLNGIVPEEPLNFKNGDIGAWEIAIRYDGLAAGANMFRPVNQGGLGISAIDNATAVNGFSAALNWYINRIVRLGLTIEYQAFTGGGGRNTVVENNELGFITRLQLNY